MKNLFLLAFFVFFIFASLSPELRAQTSRQFFEPAPGKNFSCTEDSDCVIKNFSNCCGITPVCANKSATPPDPEEVARSCAEKQMNSICGFAEISGCHCVKGACAGISSPLPPEMRIPDARTQPPNVR